MKNEKKQKQREKDTAVGRKKSTNQSIELTLVGHTV